MDNVQSPRKERKKRRQQDNVDLEATSPKVISKTPSNESNAIVEDRHGIELAENKEGEGMPRGEDGMKDRKKRNKERNDGATGVVSSGIDGKEVGNERELLEENIIEKAAENGGDRDSTVYKAGEGMPRAEDENKYEKKRKKRKRERDVGDTSVESGGIAEGAGNEKELLEENIMGKVGHSRKERKKKNKHNIDLESAEKIMGNKLCNESSAIESKAGDGEIRDHSVTAECANEVKKKKVKAVVKNGSDGKVICGSEWKMGSEATDPFVKSTLKGTSKRVRFSEDVEIFPSSDGPSDEGAIQEGELVRGKRFSHEEDKMVKEAVLNYISNHELGEEGLKMILQCKKYPEVKNCWKEIGAALPWRPCESVYYRAHILFERGKKCSWTEEEYELVQKFYGKYGSDWKTLAEALGKHRFHVKDTWRRIKFTTRNRGRWSQDEYETLFDLVNMDLRMKAFEEKKSKHGMLRDNICWTAISEKLGTRATAMCCMKWYDQLTSPMVAEGKWLDVDDYRLLIALYDVDACCMEDVDWDSLLEHRPGDVCRKRWNQMVKHLGEHKNESFADHVEVLIKRYCPDVLEAREVYDNKPVVD